jgi:hypothetical protein
MAMYEILNAFLWRMGGDGYPLLHRNWRRVGYPLILILSLLGGAAAWPVALLTGILAHLTTRLPLTFIGNSLYTHWFNWVWVWVLGYIYGLPSVLVHGWAGFLLSIIPMVTVGMSLTLSNVSGVNSKTFTHEFCEAVTGFAVMRVML